MAGKKAGRAVAGKRSGPTGPLPVGDTVHRQRPNTCVAASNKRTTDLGYRFHDNGFLQAGISKARIAKQADRAARDQGHDEFASLVMATRRPDRPMQNGWPEFSAWTSLAATMRPHPGDSAHRLSWRSAASWLSPRPAVVPPCGTVIHFDMHRSAAIMRM